MVTWRHTSPLYYLFTNWDLLSQWFSGISEIQFGLFIMKALPPFVSWQTRKKLSKEERLDKQIGNIRRPNYSPWSIIQQVPRLIFVFVLKKKKQVHLFRCLKRFNWFSLSSWNEPIFCSSSVKASFAVLITEYDNVRSKKSTNLDR